MLDDSENVAILVGIHAPSVEYVSINTMSATCRLVKNTILSFTEPIGEGVRISNLTCKVVMQYFQSLIMIGLRN